MLRSGVVVKCLTSIATFCLPRTAMAVRSVLPSISSSILGPEQTFASKELAIAGQPWSVGDYHGNRSMQLERKDSSSASPVTPGILSNVLELAGTMPSALSSMKFEAYTLYAGIPAHAVHISKWAAERIGSQQAQFLQNIRGIEVRRAFCFGLRENYLPPTSGEPPGGMPTAREWKLPDRARLLYVFARTVNSAALSDCAVELFWRSDCGETESAGGGKRRSKQDVEEELAKFASCDDADVGGAPLAAARRVTFAEATAMEQLTPTMVADLTECCTPEAVIELASLLSFAEMWRRMLLLFSLPSMQLRMEQITGEFDEGEDDDQGW